MEETKARTVLQIIQEEIPNAKDIKQKLDSATGNIAIEFRIKRKKYKLELDQFEFDLTYGSAIELKFSKEFEEYQKEIIEATNPIKEKYKDMLEEKNKAVEEAASEFSEKEIAKWIEENL